jgi:hypothetical protein
MPNRAALENWTISAEPIAEIGQEDGPDHYMLSDVEYVGAFSDGRIAIGLMDDENIAVYDSTGTFIRYVGRRGRGPGEFVSRDDFFIIRGDTLLVNDRFPRELSRFTPELEYVGRTMVVRPQGAPEVDVLPGFLLGGAFQDGTLLALRHPGEKPRRPGAPPDSARPFRMAVDGRVLADFGSVPGSRPMIGVSGSQMILMSREGLRIYSGETGRLTTLARIRMPYVPKWPLPAAMAGDTIAQREWRQRPDSSPPLSTIAIGDYRGNVWVRPNRSREDSTLAWLVFDSTGALRAAVRRIASNGKVPAFPKRHQIVGIAELRIGTIAIRGDRLITLTIDSLDINRVSIYRIEKSARRGP